MSALRKVVVKGFGQIKLRCVGLDVAAAAGASVQVKTSVGTNPVDQVLDQDDNFEDDLVTDIDPSEIKKLDTV